MVKSAVAMLVAVEVPIGHMFRRFASSSLITTILPIALSALLLFGAVAVVFTRSDWTTVMASLARVSWLSIAVAFALMLTGALLASLRLKYIAHDLGYRLRFCDAVSTLSLSHLAGILFFQIAGQLMARGILLSRRRIPVSGTIAITGYERLIALAVSFTLAVAGALYLFGKVSIDTAQGGLLIIKIFLGLLTVGICGAVFCWGRLVAKNLPKLTSGMVFKLGRSAALSLVIQVATLGTYIFLLRATDPGISTLSLAAASALVMFAASLPISFSGWGMRELSAIIALGTIGVATSTSFAVAAIVGLISFSILGVMAAATIHHHHQPATIHPRQEALRFNFAAILDYGLPLLAATAVFFQVFIPVSNGAIDVNLADPGVILGGCLFVVYCLNKDWPRWRIPNFEIYVGLATLVIATGFLHGLYSFGWTNWAFTNRLLGWFVLLAYGASGALIVRHAHRQGLELLMRTFVVTAVAIIGLEVSILILYSLGLHFVKPLVLLPFAGFSFNRNAYAFQLLLAISVTLSLHWKRPSLLLGILFVGIWFSGSRASFIALPVILGMAMYMRRLPLRTTALAFAFAALALAVIAAIPELTVHFGGPNRLPFHVANMLIESAGSYTEHLKSLIGGWIMFVAHPIFGAGVGRIYASRGAERHTAGYSLHAALDIGGNGRSRVPGHAGRGRTYLLD